MSAKLPFLQRLRQDPPLLADGAMGTTLHAHGVPIDACFDELNLTRPDLVLRIHRDFVQAGAELLETNTFGANRYKLSNTAWKSARGDQRRRGEPGPSGRRREPPPGTNLPGRSVGRWACG